MIGQAQRMTLHPFAVARFYLNRAARVQVGGEENSVLSTTPNYAIVCCDKFRLGFDPRRAHLSVKAAAKLNKAVRSATNLPNLVGNEHYARPFPMVRPSFHRPITCTSSLH